MKSSAIIVAAGSSTRMGEVDKLYADILDVPAIAYTLKAFERSDVDEVTVVVREDKILLLWDIIKEFQIGGITSVVTGGATRSESVRRGLSETNGDIILVHDGARCCVTPEEINSVLAAAEQSSAAALGVAVTDTLKLVENSRIHQTVNRENLWQIQTPQGFHRDLLWKAYQSETEATDDCALVESMGVPIQIVQGKRTNIKLTTPEDLTMAMGILMGVDL